MINYCGKHQKFEPIYKERVWGGRSIETIYERRLPKAELKYGESWEIVDRQGDQSKVVGSEYHGKTLNYLWNNLGRYFWSRNARYGWVSSND